MTWVKVCGLRTPDDIAAAAAASADAIGLNLVPESPRVVSVDEARTLAGLSEVPVVVLTKDLDPDDALGLLADLGASGIQPYGTDAAETARVVAESGRTALLPHRVRGPVELDDGPVIPLLDGYSPDALGGTGTKVDEALLPPVAAHYVLAGGLNPSNVGRAVGQFAPWGVDASSGLESSLGVKDAALITAFVREAKQADTKANRS